MNLNWGYKIGLVYSLFVLVTLIMVVFFMKQDVDLVTPKYYEEEIKYQDKIDKLIRTKDEKADVKFLVGDGSLQLKFPDQADFNSTGQIHLYRPSDMKKDLKLPVNINSDNIQLINTKYLDKGVWRVLVEWNSHDAEYLSESVINLM